MDESDARKKKQSNEESGNTDDRKNFSDDKDELSVNDQQELSGSQSSHRFKQSRRHSEARSTPAKSRSELSRSRSRSRSPSRASRSSYATKRWISSNAFINFIQDFRQDLVGVRSTRIFQLAGERWRQMSPQQKQPYLEAAQTIREQRNDSKNVNRVENTNKPNTSTDQKKSGNTWKKNEKSDNNQQKKAGKNKNDNASDSESATSGTAGSVTSEDESDLSS